MDIPLFFMTSLLCLSCTVCIAVISLIFCSICVISSIHCDHLAKFYSDFGLHSTFHDLLQHEMVHLKCLKI